jgi:predicted metalloprotease
MRWRNRRRSSNIEDRRGMRPRGRIANLGVGGIVIIIVAIYFGIDPTPLLQMQSAPPATQQSDSSGAPTDDPTAEFVAVVLADTEDVWAKLFRTGGLPRYQEPTLVLFTDSVSSACGIASAAVGPFYCPGDGQIYIDLGFFADLKHRFGAPGDFAQAYVIAHEVAHHVQNLLGISRSVQNLRRQMNEKDANQLSVRTELQADCLSGVWAHHAERTKDILEQGDLEEAMNAATAIGDDRLQQQSRGYVIPDSFTHGTSEQRMRWFRAGFDTGEINACDTFEVREI